jgi:hypothetical protein
LGGWSTEGISRLPDPRNRKKASSRLYGMLWMSPIIRHPKGVALADPITMDEPPSGRFGGLFN